MQLMTITRTTTATSAALWAQLTDVQARLRWDHGLAACHLQGPYQQGATGTLQLKGQPAMTFDVTECTPLKSCTDRVHVPLGNASDWIHQIHEVNGARQLTFDIHLNGPVAFLIRGVMKRLLNREIPATVDRLIALAEQADPASHP